MGGDNERTKLRIRSYSKIGDQSTPIRAELKMRRRNLVMKQSSFVKYGEYKEFMKRGHWENTKDPVLVEFQRHMLSNLHNPKVLIEYLREGYESKTDNDLRITFDHNVKSSHSKILFPKHSFYKEHNKNAIVMEIKFRENLPAWVKDMVHRFGLRIVANSKFAQAIQISRPDISHPGNIVVIR